MPVQRPDLPARLCGQANISFLRYATTATVAMRSVMVKTAIPKVRPVTPRARAVSLLALHSAPRGERASVPPL